MSCLCTMRTAPWSFMVSNASEKPPRPGLKPCSKSADRRAEPSAGRGRDCNWLRATMPPAAGHARLVVELLTTQSPHRATELAKFLEDLNARRQQVERRKSTRRLAKSSKSTPGISRLRWCWLNPTGIRASSASSPAGWSIFTAARCSWWHCGRIARKKSDRPRLGPLGARFRGADRALAACGEHLLTHGGHAAAAGFTVIPESIHAAPRIFPLRMQPPTPRNRHSCTS